jgi:hypothetical protein
MCRLRPGQLQRLGEPVRSCSPPIQAGSPDEAQARVSSMPKTRLVRDRAVRSNFRATPACDLASGPIPRSGGSATWACCTSRLWNGTLALSPDRRPTRLYRHRRSSHEQRLPQRDAALTWMAVRARVRARPGLARRNRSRLPRVAATPSQGILRFVKLRIGA